jgi:GNAT superfamily N-acetyltransferase
MIIAMTDANFRFMARQLLLSELGGQLAAEESGLLIGTGPVVWVGICDLAAVGDHEDMVESCRQYASDTGVQLGGMLLVYEPADGSKRGIQELDESMFLLDLPRSEDAYPDNIQMMFGPPKHAKTAGYALRQASWQDEDVLELLTCDPVQAELMAGPALAGHLDWPQLLECNVLLHSGNPVALAGTLSTDLASRLCYILVRPELRRRGMGRVLVSLLAQSGQEQGKMLLNCWTQRSGKLRYFTSKAGFEDKLSVRWYLAAK